MKKCVLKSGENLVNEQGQPMFSGTGTRKYQSTGAITLSAAIQIRKHEGKYIEDVNVPRNLPKHALGSIFNETKAEYKVLSSKLILSVKSIEDIDLLRYTAKTAITAVQKAYDSNESLQFKLKGRSLGLTNLAKAKEQVRNVNNNIRNSIEGQVRSQMRGNSPDQQARIINRAYLNKKQMLSPISVVITVQLSHNVYSSNYAESNVDLSTLDFDKYINNNGTYTSKNERGLTFSIPCNSVDHANSVLSGINKIIRQLNLKLPNYGFEQLVDMTDRKDAQIANDEAIKAKLSEQDNPNLGAEAIDEIEDESTTSERSILDHLGVVSELSSTNRLNLFDED